MFPALFLSHGAPTLPLETGPARDFLAGLGKTLPRPDVILAVSAHWDTENPTLSAAARNSTYHDFRGFPAPLYELSYNAPGAPEVAAALARQLAAAGFAVGTNDRRGLDHGAWVPLLLAYPETDIPVLQLSIQSRRGAAHHLALGRALRDFRRHGLILASGGFVHNLAALAWEGGSEPAWSRRFSEWMDRALVERRDEDLVAYRRRAPDAALAHPSEDHILPLFVAYGAGEHTSRLHSSATLGSLRMDAYRFD